MIESLATLHSFWFIFGIGCGVICTCILLLFMSFLDEKPRIARYKKEVEKAKKEGYELGRDWDIGEKLYLEKEIDNLWYEVEELKSQVEKLNHSGLYADGKPIYEWWKELRCEQ